MKKIFGILCSVIALFVLLVTTPHRSFAIDGCSNTDESCIDSKIQEYQQKITELQGQQKTLSATIQYLDSKTKLTEGEIFKTEYEIALLEKQIAILETRIDGLELSLERLTQVLIERIRDNYKKRNENPLLLLIASDNAGDFILRYKYRQLSQKLTRDMINEAEEQKIAYDEEKLEEERKRKEVENLRAKLQAQKVLLQQQKSQKQTILTATKNDESKFQSLLSQALAEKNALEAALISGKQVGPVKKGDSIALVGNSGYPGCSTGEHLHFEVRKGNQWVDPGNYVSSKTVQDQEKGGSSTIGGGSWDWPLSDPIILTQHFGQTPYSWRYKYSGGIHTGFDMVSSSSKIIRAPADGTLFTSSQSCGSSSVINIKYIEHADGVISFYLHVQ
jgi:septal ring factor EnvC (AmiA/AmiB activator)